MAPRITGVSARLLLVCLWLAAFFAALGIVTYLYVSDQIEADNWSRSVSAISALYAPYVGIIIGFAVAVGSPEPQRRGRDRQFMLLVTFGCSVGWNVLALVFLGELLFGVGRIEDSIDRLNFIGSTLSWLVAPLIGAYFGRLLDHGPVADEREPR
jgi:hypothetical protein